MSFFTFLLFASVVYLCAADPIEAPAISDQDYIDKFMADVEVSYVENIASLFSGLSEDDRDYLKTTTMNGVAGFINFCLFRAKQATDSGFNSKTFDDGDLIMQFDSEDPFLTAIPYQQPPALCPKA